MPERPLTLMAVHAHPDDEATSTGGVFAKAAAEGIRTVLVTCTDGSCGDAPGGIKPGEPGHDPVAVAALRLPELEASCELLGIQHLEMLGYVDSGMMGWPNNDAPGSFWHTPVETAAAQLAELIDKWEPDVIVTYDENGFYGHPDHIQANRITVAAMAISGSPAKLYWTTAPRSMVDRMGEIVRELGGDWDEDAAAAEASTGEPPVEIGVPDDEITTWVDVQAYGPAKFAALAAHASQSENIFFLKMGEEKFTEIWGSETFIRIQDKTGAEVPESDLFAGLR